MKQEISLSHMRSRTYIEWLLLFAAFFVSAECAAAGAPFTPETRTNDGKALIYVYRPKISINCCVAPHIFINNQKSTQLKNGGYLVFTVDPGPLTLEAVNELVGFKSLKLTIDCEAGQSYYFRWAAAATLGPGFFSSKEAKKRSKEETEGTLKDVVRATDTDTMNRSVLATVDHERELRLMDSDEALKEIIRTKRFN